MKITPKQRAIAEHLLRAEADHEIARKLNICLGNVKMTLHRLCSKFQLPRDGSRHLKVLLAMAIHEHRSELGVRCQACGEC